MRKRIPSRRSIRSILTNGIKKKSVVHNARTLQLPISIVCFSARNRKLVSFFLTEIQLYLLVFNIFIIKKLIFKNDNFMLIYADILKNIYIA